MDYQTPKAIRRFGLLFLASTAVLLSAAEKKETKKDTEITVEGAILRFEPLPIPPRRRTPEGELALLETVEARLHIEKGVSYRRQHAEPGDYSVRIEATETGEYVLVLKNLPKVKKKAKKKKKTKKPVEPSSKKDAETPAKKGNGDDSAPAAFRAALLLSEMEDATETVSFSMSLLRKGSRLRIRVRAGTTSGQSMLRFGTKEAEKVPKNSRQD